HATRIAKNAAAVQYLLGFIGSLTWSDSISACRDEDNSTHDAGLCPVLKALRDVRNILVGSVIFAVGTRARGIRKFSRQNRSLAAVWRAVQRRATRALGCRMWRKRGQSHEQAVDRGHLRAGQ
ncbi:MAG: hypothetical protein ACI81R_003450, partial [Bradymonadia bacterium]